VVIKYLDSHFDDKKAAEFVSLDNAEAFVQSLEQSLILHNARLNI
jgi:hypothetical protein